MTQKVTESKNVGSLCVYPPPSPPCKQNDYYIRTKQKAHIFVQMVGESMRVRVQQWRRDTLPSTFKRENNICSKSHVKTQTRVQRLVHAVCRSSRHSLCTYPGCVNTDRRPTRLCLYVVVAHFEEGTLFLTNKTYGLRRCI